MFLDLVKAFDRVPRVLLWLVLEKAGVPEKLTNLLKALHSNVSVSIKSSGAERHFTSLVGVKQGDTLGPLLFIYFIGISSHPPSPIPTFTLMVSENNLP